MLEIKNGYKHFENTNALKGVSCTVQKGSIFGIVGSNGAGKSTILRAMCGVYSLDAGDALLDGKKIYNNPEAKQEILYLSDTPPTGFGMTMKKAIDEYKCYYPQFDKDEYKELLQIFKLNENKPMSSFSKGMLRQAMIIIALSMNTSVIILDETLDGLDPVIRGLVKKKIYTKVLDKKTTVIISSHSLRELEDFCDTLMLLHEGELIFTKSTEDSNVGIVKVQAALEKGCSDELYTLVDVISCEKTGSVCNMLVKGVESEIIKSIKTLNPKLLEVVPLSLEEIFAYELTMRGYAVDKDKSALNLEEK